MTRIWPVILGGAGMIALCALFSAAIAVAEEQPSSKSEAIDFDRARALMKKRNQGEKLSADEEAFLKQAREEFQRQKGQGKPAAGRTNPRQITGETIKLTPLTDMSADDDYQGEDGGLYGAGRNRPPEALQQAAEAELRRVQPLDSEGHPSPEGRIVLMSISMSNATQEFSAFKQIADKDPHKSSTLTIVDCAQGGQAMAEWAPPNAQPWKRAEERLQAAGVTPQQVQVAWVKLANKGPTGDLQEHGQKLKRDTAAVVQNAKSRYPNLRIVYLSSRIYAGYASAPLNPEPYAYESAFVARRLIRDQQIGSEPVKSDEPAKAPLLLWGPYFWADGVTPRKADQLVWLRDDLAGDGTHPSNSGKKKVAEMLLDFFSNDPLARSWYRGEPVEQSGSR